MKLLYCSDLHVDAGHYARLVEAAANVGPDAVVLGGSFLPDDSALVPESMGLEQPKFVRTEFRALVERIRSGPSQPQVLVIFGNRDWGSSALAADELVQEGLLRVLTHKKSLELAGMSFLGYSCTPPTPWFVKDFERLDMPGDRPPFLGGGRWDPRFSRVATHSASVLYTRLPPMGEELAEMAAPSAPWIFVAHAPPFETALDEGHDHRHHGSRAIRSAIERHRPILSLHGHVKESPRVSGAFQQRLADTIAVNVGQETGVLSYARIEIDEGAGRVMTVEHGRQA